VANLALEADRTQPLSRRLARIGGVALLISAPVARLNELQGNDVLGNYT
jgi:hypothetical protein